MMIVWQQRRKESQEFKGRPGCVWLLLRLLDRLLDRLLEGTVRAAWSCFPSEYYSQSEQGMSSRREAEKKMEVQDLGRLNHHHRRKSKQGIYWMQIQDFYSCHKTTMTRNAYFIVISITGYAAKLIDLCVILASLVVLGFSCLVSLPLSSRQNSWWFVCMILVLLSMIQSQASSLDLRNQIRLTFHS